MRWHCPLNFGAGNEVDIRSADHTPKVRLLKCSSGWVDKNWLDGTIPWKTSVGWRGLPYQLPGWGLPGLRRGQGADCVPPLKGDRIQLPESLRAARKGAGVPMKWLTVGVSVGAKDTVEGVEVPECSEVVEVAEGPVCVALGVSDFSTDVGDTHKVPSHDGSNSFDVGSYHSNWASTECEQVFDASNSGDSSASTVSDDLEP